MTLSRDALFASKASARRCSYSTARADNAVWRTVHHGLPSISMSWGFKPAPARRYRFCQWNNHWLQAMPCS
ncbi:hypothetical protein, partial [Thiolapillus sp.]|uniref:hypothetical protein n=1 Tax=Thiolapillus sp. TaxID=2017437 RepID=UPI003AF7B551